MDNQLRSQFERKQHEIMVAMVDNYSCGLLSYSVFNRQNRSHED